MAAVSTSGVPSNNQKIKDSIGRCATTIAAPKSSDSNIARTAVSWSSAWSPLPKHWATNPVVPMRRKPNPQYNELKINAPIATPPINTGSGSRPITAVSTIPARGIDRFERIMGHASDQIRPCHSRVLRGVDTSSMSDWCPSRKDGHQFGTGMCQRNRRLKSLISGGTRKPRFLINSQEGCLWMITN